MTVNASLNGNVSRPKITSRWRMVLALAVLGTVLMVSGLWGGFYPGDNRADTQQSFNQTAPLRQLAYEKNLEERVSALLATIYGAENVRVTLHADMNFSERQTITEKYDPDGQVARSSFNRINGLDISPSDLDGTSEEKVEYEISKSTTTVTEDEGTIRKLSAAILINSEAQSILPAQAESLEPLVRNALGFDARRGDQLEIAYLPFSTMAAPAPEFFAGGLSQNSNLFIIAGLATASLLLLVIYGLFRPRRPLNPTGPDDLRQGPSEKEFAALKNRLEGEIEGAAGIEPMISTNELRSRVAQLVDQNPDRALAIMRSWLHERKKQEAEQ